MKKTLFLFSLALLASAIFPFFGIGMAVIANLPFFAKVPTSIEELEKLTENFSSFNGEEYDQFSSYEGNALMSLIDTSRVFTITLTASGGAVAAGHTIFLLPGFNFVAGKASQPGVLSDGAVSTTFSKANVAITNLLAVGSPVTNASLRGTNNASIETLLRYLDTNPTLLNMIKFTYNTAATGVTGNLIYRELSPFQELETKSIPLAQNQNEFALNYKISQINLLPYNIIAGSQSQLEYTIPALASGESIVIEMYFAKTINQSAQLKQQVFAAKQIIPSLGNISNLPDAKPAVLQNNTTPISRRLS